MPALFLIRLVGSFTVRHSVVAITAAECLVGRCLQIQAVQHNGLKVESRAAITPHEIIQGLA